ncbi:MAG TPA: thioredoxin [Longimicrobiales bacterium]
MNAHVMELSDATFAEQVEQGEGLVLVDFWAPWCAPCRIVAPAVERLAERYAGRVQFGKLNVDEAPLTASSYGISSIPTIALFRDGEPVNGVLGAVPEQHLAEMIEAELAKVEVGK